MPKTQFSESTILRPEWLNGAQQIDFRGEDRDWSFQPLTLDSISMSGNRGFDSRYFTLTSEQTVTGNKVVLGRFDFGDEAQEALLTSSAPRSFTTNAKWFGGTQTGSLDRLNDADLITKLILLDTVQDLRLTDLEDLVCSNPLDGYMSVYEASEEAWTCGDTIDGGNY